MDWQRIDFDWNHARAFLAAAEEGSYSAAARALGTAQPTIGRQVAALEAELGVTLFERVGRGIALTPTGLDLLDELRAMRDAATRVSLVAAGQAASLDGEVTITASQVVTAYVLPPILAAIRRTHPGIRLELVASNSAKDLLRREADIAVRNFRPTEPDLIARHLRHDEAHLYATPGYLASIGPPRTPADLLAADFFGFDRTDLMIKGLNALGIAVTPAHFPLTCADHMVQWALCRQGLGVCIIMACIGDADPTVQRVLPDLPPLPIPMWLTCHRELQTSRRVRAVFDLLAEGLSEDVSPAPGRSPAGSPPGL
ncbi:MAG: LysR family transcriptional regulator [bacterium]